jgi:hypothetical protein
VVEAKILCDRAFIVGASTKEKPYSSTAENMKIQNGKGVNGYSNMKITNKVHFKE